MASRRSATVVGTLVLLLLGAVLLWGRGDRSRAPEPQQGRTALVSPSIPDESWEERAPVELGVDASKLEEFKEMLGLGSFGCVIHKGYLIDSWGPKALTPLRPFASRRGWASATKAFFAVLLLIEVEEGRIPGLDVPLVNMGWNLDEGVHPEMTLRHLLDMTSGYGLPEDPGEAFAYNDYAVSLLLRLILENVYHVRPTDLETIHEVVRHPDRLGPLDFKSDHLFRLRHDLPRLDLSPCDFARLGLLLKRTGRWDTARVLAPETVERHFRTVVPNTIPLTRADTVKDHLDVGTAGGGFDQTDLGCPIPE